MLTFDHLAIVAPTLEKGVAFVAASLGITVPTGGKHPYMGTHNCLMRLGDDEFLEIIAIDPAAPKPHHPRWFALDTLLPNRVGLGNWIVRTDHIDQAIATFPPSIGLNTNLQRDKLTWKITVPDDGSMPFDGAFPTIIEWPFKPYPGSSMTDLGCSLIKLTIRHPNATIIAKRLKPYLRDQRIEWIVSKHAGLTAEIQTPNGLRTLEGL